MGGFIATRRADWYEGAKRLLCTIRRLSYLRRHESTGYERPRHRLDENTEFDNLETRIKQVEYLAKKTG